MEKFIPLAKILHCRRQWQISPLHAVTMIADVVAMIKERVLIQIVA